jgi:DNA repair protein RecN (Recombination protein N)
MLSSLFIENFAIVAHLELDFDDGMTAFTGETGAGKSIMIDALMLALGGRADASVVRPGAEKCEIHARFTFDAASEPAHWLAEHDLSTDAHEVFLRRVITLEGRSKSYINGQPFPLQKVKAFSECLVDIHGQHQHQRLLQHATHRQQLDQYANHHALLADVSRLYRECLHLKNAQEALKTSQTNEERSALLHYQIDELKQLNPQMDEMHALHIEHQLLHHAKDYLEQTEQVRTALEGGDEHLGLNQHLHVLLQTINTLPLDHPRIKNTQELIQNALIQCEEALDEVGHFATDIQLDPDRLQTVEARMSQLHQAARKYHVDANQLPGHLEHLEAELSQLNHCDSERHRLDEQYQFTALAYEKAALKLRQSREHHAALLAQDIGTTIRQLGIPQGIIELRITPLETMHIHGLDKVEYHVCTNPGLALDTLSKIASGGELSRISLSIQLITAQKRSATPTLLFDEVDVGIGGTTAALVGRLLRKLGTHLQVFCVTHQPQVASCAHHHYLVEKHIKNDQTFSTIHALTPPETIQEIARMLGGLSITEQTRSHAHALIQESHADVENGSKN